MTTTFISCSPKIAEKTPTSEPVATIESPIELEDELEPKILMDGDTKDEHGCIASAGYQWSEVRNECIRIWEVGIELLNLDEISTSAAYLIFNQDSGKVEVFLPGDANIILTKNENNWIAVGSDFSIAIEGNSFVLYEKEVLKYRSEQGVPK